MFQESDCYLTEVGYWIDKKNKKFFRNRFVPYGFSVPILRKERNNTGIFTSAFRYTSDAPENRVFIGDLYFDFDKEGDFEAVREDALTALAYLKTVFKVSYEETRIYFSGKKGIHITVPHTILGVEPDKNLNLVYKSIAKKVSTFTSNGTLDHAVYDSKRMFRVPYSKHEDTELHKIELSFDELRNYSYEKIKEEAKEPRKINIKHPSSVNTFGQRQFAWFKENYQDILEIKMNDRPHDEVLRMMPPCIEDLLENGSQKGGRNNSTAVVASFYKSTGKTFEETIELCEAWNNEKNTPALHPKEVKNTVQSIYRGRASYGCNTLRTLAKCDIDRCPLKKGKKNGK